MSPACGDRKASASPDRTLGCGPSHIWLAPCRLQHATYTLQSIIWGAPANTVVVLWTTAIPLCVSLSSKFPRNAKGVESRHVEDCHRASIWSISRLLCIFEPRRGCLSGCQQRCSNLCMIAQDHRRALYAVVQYASLVVIRGNRRVAHL